MPWVRNFCAVGQIAGYLREESLRRWSGQLLGVSRLAPELGVSRNGFFGWAEVGKPLDGSHGQPRAAEFGGAFIFSKDLHHRHFRKATLGKSRVPASQGSKISHF